MGKGYIQGSYGHTLYYTLIHTVSVPTYTRYCILHTYDTYTYIRTHPIQHTACALITHTTSDDTLHCVLHILCTALYDAVCSSTRYDTTLSTASTVIQDDMVVVMCSAQHGMSTVRDTTSMYTACPHYTG